MAAEIVMIVENENPGIFPGELAEEIRGGQPANPAAHHDQIVVFIISSRFGPLLAVAQVMCHFKRSGMAAAQSRLCRRIVARILFRRERRIRNSKCVEPRTCRYQRSTHRNAHAIEEVPPRDTAPHAQLTIVDGILWTGLSSIAHGFSCRTAFSELRPPQNVSFKANCRIRGS